MKDICKFPGAICASVMILGAMAAPAHADLTAEASAFLADGGVDAAIIDQANAASGAEFDIPQDWIDKAAAEGPIDFSTNDTPQHVAKWLPVFNARYPDIQIEATETSGAARAVQPLLGYKAGSLVRHIVVSFEGSLPDYIDADALEELSDLPAYQGVPEDRKAANGTYAGMQNTTWCLAYNTENITAEAVSYTHLTLPTNREV